MIKSPLVLAWCAFALHLNAGQSQSKSAANASTVANSPVVSASAKPTQASPSGPDELKTVLAQAKKAAETFRSAKAKFQWDQYEKVVDETEVQKGEVFFRRSRTGTDAAVRVTSPDAKQVVFVDGTLKLFQPKIKQLTVYDAKAKRAEVDSLMNIGFGSRSEDILKSYEVTMEGWETVDGIKTARLNLVPKNEKLRSSVTNIILWLDPVRDISVRQKFMEPGGNYRLTHYTEIDLNGKISNDVFELKTPAGTTIVRP
jgi:outer membrane lipoprotein-sorting protein